MNLVPAADDDLPLFLNSAHVIMYATSQTYLWAFLTSFDRCIYAVIGPGAARATFIVIDSGLSNSSVHILLARLS